MRTQRVGVALDAFQKRSALVNSSEHAGSLLLGFRGHHTQLKSLWCPRNQAKTGNAPALQVAPGVALLRNACNQASAARIGTSRPSFTILEGHSAADVVEPGELLGQHRDAVQP
jgi:hypothetical protein